MQSNCTRSFGGVSYIRSAGTPTFKLLQVGGHRADQEIKGWAMVDAADYPALAEFRWTIMRGYVVTAKGRRGSQRQIYLHRHIMGLTPRDAVVVDHINRDTLDNRRNNLRVITRGQNLENQGLSKANTSGYRGVRKHRNRWVAQCKVRQENKYIGTFDTAEEAAEAARAFRLQHLPFATD